MCAILGMYDYILVERSPERQNVFLCCKEFLSIPETFTPIAKKLMKERTNMGRIIVFCKKRMLCSQIYSFFQFYLRHEFFDPPDILTQLMLDWLTCSLLELMIVSNPQL